MRHSLYACVMQTEGSKHSAPVAIRHSIPGTVTGIAVNTVVFPDIIISGTLRIANLAFRNGYHIRGPIAGQYHIGKCGFPDRRCFYIRFRIGVTNQRMLMGFQTTAIAGSGMFMVFPTRTHKLFHYFCLFEAGITMNMDCCIRFCTNQHRFRRLREFLIPFFQAAAQNRIPLVTIVTVSVTRVYRNGASQFLIVTLGTMDMILRNFTLKLRFISIARHSMFMNLSFFSAANRDGFIAGISMDMIFDRIAMDCNSITAFTMMMLFFRQTTS